MSEHIHFGSQASSRSKHAPYKKAQASECDMQASARRGEAGRARPVHWVRLFLMLFYRYFTFRYVPAR